MTFGKRLALPLAIALMFAPVLAGPAVGSDRQAGENAANQIEKVEDAIRILEEMMKESDKSIPVSLIEEAAGIAIIPDVIRAGLIIGGRHGKGVLLVRTEAGGWSDPAFIDIKGGSIGWQAGVQSADVVLVFRTPRSIEDINEGKFTLGADAGIAAGPVGRTAEASTDSELKAEILSYSRSRGLFVGLTLQGSSIQNDRKANRNFYGRDISPKDILAGKSSSTPAIVSRLKAALANLSK
jgi:lipid-binding SYLF domain-containing protein